MTEPTQSHASSLTGVWNGLYTYPYKLDSVFFMATLIETGSTVSGSMNETNSIEPAVGSALLSTISGRRQGSRVSFLKSYEGGWTHSVDYDGTLNADETEIEGRWSILGDWSGKFLMIRSTGKTEAVVRKVAESMGAGRGGNRNGHHGRTGA